METKPPSLDSLSRDKSNDNVIYIIDRGDPNGKDTGWTRTERDSGGNVDYELERMKMR